MTVRKTVQFTFKYKVTQGWSTNPLQNNYLIYVLIYVFRVANKDAYKN